MLKYNGITGIFHASLRSLCFYISLNLTIFFYNFVPFLRFLGDLFLFDTLVVTIFTFVLKSAGRINIDFLKTYLVFSQQPPPHLSAPSPIHPSQMGTHSQPAYGNLTQNTIPVSFKFFLDFIRLYIC